MLKRFMTVFLKGFFAVLPLLLSVYILFWIFGSAESVVRPVLLLFIPDWAYIPGMGIATSVVVIAAIGLLMERTVARKIMKLVEELVTIMPMVRTIYGAIKDFTSYLAPSSGQRSASRVVLVRLPNSEMDLAGLVTRESLADLPAPLNRDQCIAVYLPMSYQFGGYTVFVPRSQVRELPMGTEAAMRSVLTAWMKGASKP